MVIPGTMSRLGLIPVAEIASAAFSKKIGPPDRHVESAARQSVPTNSVLQFPLAATRRPVLPSLQSLTP